MATSTTNLGLIKPSGSDKIRIAQINQNMDTIDSKMGPVGNTSLQAQLNTTNQALAKYGNAAGTRITSGGDLNNVTTAGNYYVDTASDAANIGNMPLNIGGRLEVTEINGSSRLRQIFFTNSSRPDVYVRSYISTGWTAWEKLAYASDVDKYLSTNTFSTAFADLAAFLAECDSIMNNMPAGVAIYPLGYINWSLAQTINLAHTGIVIGINRNADIRVIVILNVTSTQQAAFSYIGKASGTWATEWSVIRKS